MPPRAPGKTPAKPREKRGRKKLASPSSTGGSGVAYESKVQAVYLLAMFAGWPTPVLPDAEVIELRFQARIHGYNTDDLVCTLRDEAGGTRKAVIQVKSTLKALPSDEQFAESVVAAWYDFKTPSLFERGRDRLVIVFARDADQSIYFAGQLTHLARTSLTSAEFERKATAEGFSSKQHRSAFHSIRTIIATEEDGDPTADELHDFMRHLWFINHLLATDETPEVADIFGRIRLLLGAALGSNARAIWSELTTTCQRLNKEAASLSFANLDDQLSARLAAAFARHRASAAARLPFAELIAENSNGIGRGELSSFTLEDDSPVFSGTTVRRATYAVEEVALSTARDDSANRAITSRLDAINEKLKQFRYTDALEDVDSLGKDLEPFDVHQLARWHLQRGTCYWHLRDANSAAEDFIKAHRLYPDDDKMAAAGVRGLLLKDDIASALEQGKEAFERFPGSLTVWATYANARTISGEALSADDIPHTLRDEADALQLVAASRQMAEDFDGARALSLRSLEAKGAGYYVRNSALLNVLESATANKVLSTYKLVDSPTVAALRQVIQSFKPHLERLWNVQAPKSVAETAANLGTAYLLTSDNDGALELVSEAQAHGIESPELLRVALQAYHESNRVPEMLAYGREHLARLKEDALVGLAQAAANVGDFKLVDDVAAAAAKLDLQRADTVDVMKAIRWMAMWNSADRDRVVNEVLEADIGSASSLPLVIAGVRVLWKTHRTTASAGLARGEALVAADPVPEKKALFADMLFDIKEFAKAAQLYETVLPNGQVSELHNRLLHCFIRTGNRQKARKLIAGLPDGWISNDDTRGLAIELGQQVGDWTLLGKLANAQFDRTPEQVSSWLFKFMAAIRDLPAADVQAFLASAPLDLIGSIQQTTQLAALELRYGLRQKGMQRMYRLRRLSATDVESASALLLSFVSVTETLPDMEESLELVEAGCHVVLVEEDGRAIDVTLDPVEVGPLPETEEFRSSSSADVAKFLGRGIGDKVTLEGAFRMNRTLTVQSISSAYRRLLALARDQMDRSLAPVPNATSIPVPTTATGEADFSHLHEQLKKQSAHIKESFSRYRTMPMTLGILCRMVGKSPVDAVRAWPVTEETPPLFVTGGTTEEREQALAQLKDSAASYIVDAATVTELVSMGLGNSLKALPKVYVASVTRDLLHSRLEEAKLERSSGQVFDEGGRIGFVEYSKEDHQKNVQRINEVIEALEAYCDVLPAYGPEATPEVLVKLERVLSDEEHAVLLLAVEKSLCLLTVDGRLRSVASLVDVPGVWPQVLAMHAADIGHVSAMAYSLATVRMFLSNRTFVSLGSHDLLLMCHQGTSWARIGITRFKKYLADPSTEFKSALSTALRFIAAAAAACTYMGALAELLRHAIEGLMRHKDCPEDVLDQVETVVRGLLVGTQNPYPIVREREGAELAAQLRYLVEAMVEGLRWSKEPPVDRPVRLDVYFVGRTPWLSSSVEESNRATGG